VEVVDSLSQGRTAAAQCGLFIHKSVPIIFEPPCSRFQLLFFSLYFIIFYKIYVLYQQHLSVMNKATYKRNTWKCYRPLGCDAVYSGNFLDILEELTISVWSKYEVDGFRNVGKFLPFYPSSNPRRQESAEPPA